MYKEKYNGYLKLDSSVVGFSFRLVFFVVVYYGDSIGFEGFRGKVMFEFGKLGRCVCVFIMNYYKEC